MDRRARPRNAAGEGTARCCRTGMLLREQRGGTSWPELLGGQEATDIRAGDLKVECNEVGGATLRAEELVLWKDSALSVGMTKAGPSPS